MALVVQFEGRNRLTLTGKNKIKKRSEVMILTCTLAKSHGSVNTNALDCHYVRG